MKRHIALLASLLLLTGTVAVAQEYVPTPVTISSEKVKLTKLLNARQAQAKEIREYEEKVHHLADQMIKIDLDDGVKHNYAIFKDVLAKIK